MTITEDIVTEDTETETKTETETETTAKRGRKRERDFTKFATVHQELADYINTHSGLEPVTPNQVKAMLALRLDFDNTPEKIAAREARKAAVAIENARYEGMTEAEKTVAKAIKAAEDQAARLVKKAEEAMAKARELAAAATGSGEDLAKVVEAEQNGSDSTEGETRTRLGRNRNR